VSHNDSRRRKKNQYPAIKMAKTRAAARAEGQQPEELPLKETKVSNDKVTKPKSEVKKRQPKAAAGKKAAAAAAAAATKEQEEPRPEPVKPPVERKRKFDLAAVAAELEEEAAKKSEAAVPEPQVVDQVMEEVCTP
jgi:hypothetical protein